MRSGVLAVGVSSMMILAGVVAPSSESRPTDHEHPAAGLPGARHPAGQPFTTLPSGVHFLRFENFPTTRTAQDAATPASAVVEWAGKVWLLTLGSKGGRSSGATLVAEIGPVPEIPLAARYVLDVNEADF